MSENEVLTPTERVLISMLKEHVGTSFLDSGGTPNYDSEGNYTGSSHGYGRHYERNQARQFINEPVASLTFKWDDPEVTLNLFPWLSERIEYHAELDSIFHRYANLIYAQDNYNFNWLQCIADFIELLDQSNRYEVGYGFYGDGSEPVTINTYNGEDLLSQTLQYTMVDINQETVYFLQIHNGADVRGGYTEPRVFIEAGYSDYALLDNARAYIACENGHNWNTDDSYNWYYDGCCSSSTDHLNLQNMPVIHKDETPVLDLIEYWFNNRFLQDYTILADSDGMGDCPVCGSGLRAAG